MASLFESLKRASGSALRALDKKSIQWFASSIKKLKGGVAAYTQFSKGLKVLKPANIGQMVFFIYEAKWGGGFKPPYHAKLPYWDRFPLVFIMKVQGDRFHGVNFHYLPPALRWKLLDAINDIDNDIKKTKKQKEYIKYHLLLKATKLVKACYKTYLLDPKYLRSNFTVVPKEEWRNTVLLGRENFYTHWSSPDKAKRVYVKPAKKFPKGDVFKDSEGKV